MIWQLDRPQPALPDSYVWTWDHSTNWMLDDPGMLNFGCNNDYLKRPETFVEDYRRLTDLLAGLGIPGLAIWGFLRDSHGGVEYAKRVASYAASKGVRVMPGVGTTWYGGVYHQGNHPYNLETFLEKTPDARGQMLDEVHGQLLPGGACPSSPAFQEWLQEGLQWLFSEFEIGGANIENGDFMNCQDPRCMEHKRKWSSDDPEFFRYQAMSYIPSARALESRLDDTLVSCATYTGFLPASSGLDFFAPQMHCDRPAMFDHLPSSLISQWTGTGMLFKQQLPMMVYLDEGAPAAAFENPNWPADLKPPSLRSSLFIHQGSQWGGRGRYNLEISAIKEACLRAYRSGIQGVVIHTEVTSRSIPNALNYLAYSHFIHWPQDSLRDFGRKTLGQVFEDDDEGERFIEAVAYWEAGSVSQGMKKDVAGRGLELARQVYKGVNVDKWRFYQWLHSMITGRLEPHTKSFL